MNNFDFDNLEKMIAEKYISRQKHPTLDLYIYNYTQKAQFDRVWNNETLQCRGLIMDGNNNIVSRPFPKFFNLGDNTLRDMALFPEAVPEGDFIVTEKMDGSLGISYFDPDGKMYIATRGSFVSDQAKKANELLENYSFPELNPIYTYLFEIIYPQNRIVVDYGKEEKLVLLTVIDTPNGTEWPYEHVVQTVGRYFPVVPRYDGITEFHEIEERPNSEGYVVYFPSSGLRFKVKHQEYVRLHKIVTGVNKKRVWEFLKEGQDLEPLLDRVPDEFYEWIANTAKELWAEYFKIGIEASNLYYKVSSMDTRREQAIAIKDSPYRGIVFNMLDEKPYDQIIWKMIEPEFERPFKVEI